MSILYQDMAFHNGKVYAVANGGDLYEHEISEDSDTGEPRVSGIQRVMDIFYRRQYHLVTKIICSSLKSSRKCHKLYIVTDFNFS